MGSDQNILRDPGNCPECFNLRGRNIRLRLSGSRRHRDRCIWRCFYRNCGYTKSVRANHNLFGPAPRATINLILQFCFTHFCYVIPPATTRRVFGLTYPQIKKISDQLSAWIAEFVDNEDQAMGQTGGNGRIIEINECFFF